MSRVLQIFIVVVCTAFSVEAGSFWNKLGAALTAVAEPKETAQTVVQEDFASQLQTLDSLSTKANRLAESARARLQTLKANYAAIESTYGALFPAEVTNSVATVARETLSKIKAKIAEGETSVSEMTTKARRMASASTESAALEPTEENLTKIQSLARTMLDDLTALKAEDKSLTNLIALALAQLGSLKPSQS